MTPRIIVPSSHRNMAPNTAIDNNSESYSMLYIGSDPNNYSAAINFSSQTSVNSFLSATQLIKRLITNETKIPDLIIIDLKFNEQSLIEFTRFLKRSRYTKFIPIIYNEQAISVNQIKEITRLQLADDIVDISLFSNELLQKAIFLHKCKTFLKEKSCYQSSTKKDCTKLNRTLINFRIRRTTEILIASFLLILCSPIIILITILIKAESKGPVIYRSKRTGKGCRIFEFYKFRTMYADADAAIHEMQGLNIYPVNRNSPIFFKALNDPRITRVGIFLRNTSLDELPQLINVIKGDMSLVGNRPLPLYEAATLTTDQWAERFLAPAGITGLWQVLKKYKKNMSTKERLFLDINYARNNNFMRDCWIVANTPGALFQKDKL